jgi:hypothetical protein
MIASLDIGCHRHGAERRKRKGAKTQRRKEEWRVVESTRDAETRPREGHLLRVIVRTVRREDRENGATSELLPGAPRTGAAQWDAGATSRRDGTRSLLRERRSE